MKYLLAVENTSTKGKKLQNLFSFLKYVLKEYLIY